MSECEECNGNGYILKKHERKTCGSCMGKSILTPLLPKPVSQEMQKELDRKIDVENKIEQLQDQIEDKESEIEDLEDEISCLESQLRELRRGY